LSFSRVQVSAAESLPSGVLASAFHYLGDDAAQTDGSLPAGKLYLFATVTVTNDTQTAVDYLGNSCFFMVADESLYEVARLEMRYTSTSANVDDRNRFLFSLAPGEGREITLGSIIDRAVLESGTLYFGTDTGGGSVAVDGGSNEPSYLTCRVFEVQLPGQP
jgi:hypothetical protein